MLKKILFTMALSTWWVLFAPLHLLALPSKWLSHKTMVADARGVLFLLRIVAGIKYKIHNLPTNMRGHIVASKHMSILEVAILMACVPDAFFIIKRELMWIPIYGWAVWRMGMLSVNRTAGATNVANLAAAVKKRTDAGMTMIIFPEGTRTKPGTPVKIKRGLLFIAESLKLPIQPVGADTGLYWPKKGSMKSGTANIWFEPPLPYNASLEEIATAIARHSA
ncbi:MAG: 1-acyl-sn-glycerol-3-phosphate acyltransferase [Alphaproteobacteria bacterium]|nr:1-acyl-sn-glycerol-3-phosphate acyltransferase [Alphaproteobacteria bacterium]